VGSLRRAGSGAGHGQAPCTRVMHADASGEIGWGAVLDSTVPASGFWRSHQQHEHITLKEPRAVHYAVESFMPELANHIVQLYEDNQAVVAILMSGTSRSPELMRELLKLFDICGLRNITLRALQFAMGRPAVRGSIRCHAGVGWHAQLAQSSIRMYRARASQSALRKGGGVDRRAVLEQPNLVPRAFGAGR
jgi:hypothetical protein